MPSGMLLAPCPAGGRSKARRLSLSLGGLGAQSIRTRGVGQWTQRCHCPAGQLCLGYSASDGDRGARHYPTASADPGLGFQGGGGGGMDGDWGLTGYKKSHVLPETHRISPAIVIAFIDRTGEQRAGLTG